VGYYSGSAVSTTVKNCFNVGRAAYGIVGSAATNATGNVVDSYTLDTADVAGSTNALVLTNTKKLTAAALRGSVSTMGVAFAEDYFASNRLFPVLSWQNRDRSTTLSQKNGVY
jgi:hypothetical protein